MSDFLFSTRRRADGALRAILDRYVGAVAAQVEEWHGGWGSLAVVRAPHDPADVVVDADGWISVLVGEPVVRIGGDAPARARVGGRRAAVHRLLSSSGSVDWGDALDNAFAALAIETATGRGIAVSDIASFIPVFQAEGDAGLVLGTHVDAVARAAGRTEVDPVSAADLAATLACTFPWTLYRGVEQCPPASARRFDAAGWAGAPEAWWQPVERTPYRTVAEAGEALRDALVADVRAATRGADEAGLLLSGGEDARAVLGAVPAEVRVRAFVFADWENREVRVARAAARAHGVEDVVFGRRAPEHYAEGFADVATLIGAHNLATDVHGWGFHARLGIDRLPVVLGGFSADSLLKGGYARAGGPISLRLRGIRPALLAEASARHEAYRATIAALRPDSADEWYRIWPLGGRKHAANVDGNRRLFASHEPFHANAVVRVAAETPLAWKRRRRLFHAAFRPLLRPSWHVPHARSRFPWFGANANVALGFLLRTGRGVRDLARGELRARQAPWPKWSSVAGAQATARLWERVPPARSPLAEIFDLAGDDIRPEVRRHWHPLQQMMLLQMSLLAGDER